MDKLGIFNSSVPSNTLRRLTGSCHFTIPETLATVLEELLVQGRDEKRMGLVGFREEEEQWLVIPQQPKFPFLLKNTGRNRLQMSEDNEEVILIQLEYSM